MFDHLWSAYGKAGTLVYPQKTNFLDLKLDTLDVKKMAMSRMEVLFSLNCLRESYFNKVKVKEIKYGIE